MKSKYILIFSIALSSIFSSCSDYLNLEPVDGVIVSRFWQNKEEVRDALMGCYASMMVTDVMENYVIWGELRADLIKPRVSASNLSALSNFQNGDISSTMGFCHWGNFYRVINNCNTVLHFAKQTQLIDDSFTDQLLAEYEAEATAIRALMYFYLVRTFRDVPYITQASLSDAQNFKVSTTKGEQILDSLINDLKRIDRLQNGTNRGIPFSYGSDVRHNKGRFTVWSVKTLLADIYLWKGDYANCVNELNQVMNSGQFTLFPVSSTPIEDEDIFGNKFTVYYPSEGDADNMFLSMFVNGNSVESIFELQVGTDYQNPYYNMFNPINGSIVANMEVLSSDGLFPPSALDRGWYDIRGEGFSYRQGFVWKWIGTSRSSYTFRPNGMSHSNWIFYRLADVYLMKAEALCQLGKQSGDHALLEQSLELVKAVRARASAPETTNEILDETNINPDALEKFILLERARELAHEGKRWFDVLRHAKRNDYAGIGYLVDLATAAASPDKVFSLTNKWIGNFNSHYLPIHENELRINEALVQNPFYRN